MLSYSGVIKTHRLPLQNIPSVHTYDDSTRPAESNLSIGPKALKDIIEHFPSVKGNKGDPQLVWSFGESEVQIKSLGTSFDTKGV
jgi:cell cycle checkpoint control protein RAD9A